MTARDLARKLYEDGKGYKRIARLLKLSRNTVRSWRRRSGWNRHAPPIAPEIAPPAGHWMQSLFFECAHFVTNGKAACSAKVTDGMPWHESTGLKHCRRCMHAVENTNQTPNEPHEND